MAINVSSHGQIIRMIRALMYVYIYTMLKVNFIYVFLSISVVIIENRIDLSWVKVFNVFSHLLVFTFLKKNTPQYLFGLMYLNLCFKIMQKYY